MVWKFRGLAIARPRTEGNARLWSCEVARSLRRFAADGTDLNRNFPDQLGFALESPTQAKETTAVISWLASVPFVLSANYHGGAFVVNTPLDRYCKC